MIKYLLASAGGMVAGFIIAGLLATERLADLERENIHLEYEKIRLQKLLDTTINGVVE